MFAGIGINLVVE